MNLIVKYNIQAPHSRLYPPDWQSRKRCCIPGPAAAAGQQQRSCVSIDFSCQFPSPSPAQPQPQPSPSPSPGLRPTHHYSPTQGHKIHKFVNLFNAPAGCGHGPGP